VWGRIPQRNKNFTGREEVLGKLRAGIVGEVTAVVPHALHGLGGVGKTAMAVEYAHRFWSDYDLVWWIPADESFLVRSSLAGLAPHLGLPPATATGIEDAANAVLNALRRGEPYDRWLLIFDNADQPEEINDIIPRGPGHVLITSRNHRWEGVVDTVAIDVFNRAESVQFLQKRVPRAIGAADADRLAEALGDLPLALEQAGALQAETGMPVEEYLRLLTERTSQLLAEGKPSEYPESMTAAWALSVERLGEKFPEAVALLRCCAFFGPEPIPRDVFTQRHPELWAQFAGLLADPIKLSRAIGELGRYALVRIDPSTRTIQVHRLIQALLRDELDTEDQRRIRHEVHLLLAKAAPRAPDETANWRRYLELVAHIEPAKVVECRHPSVRELALDIVRYLYISGDSRSARTFVERLLTQWSRDSADDDLDVLNAHRHLGIVLRNLGEYGAAYELNRATLAKMQKVAGPDNEATLMLVNSIGADLRARGEFYLARDHDEDALRRYEGAFGADTARTLLVMHNLALDYGLISKYVEARALHQKVYLAQWSTGGSDQANILASWGSLARTVRLCGDYAEATDLGEEAYAYGVQELGAEYPDTLLTAKDLSVSLRRAGKLERALEMAEEVYSRCVRLFGLDHPDTLAAAMALANAQRSMGQVEAAYERASDTMRRYPTMYGEEHPYNHGCAGNLALLQRILGDVEGARELNERSLAGLEAKLGRDHHYPLTVATNLASDLAALGDVAAAVRLGQGTLRRLRVTLGEDHPMTLACAANLAADLKADGLEEEGARLREDTLDRYARTLGMDHADVVVAMEGRHLDCDFDPPPI
jgi:hypothetical protein